MYTLNIIGAGKVGKTLGYLLKQAGLVQVSTILNKRIASALAAQEFIGEGKVIADYAQIIPADIYMLTVADRAISDCARRLAEQRIILPGVIVFHCSGAVNSASLQLLQQQGAQIASLHPIKSFIDPVLDIKNFSGIYCALEGDAPACERLAELLKAIGTFSFTVKLEEKLLYHSAFVMACNHLVGLIASSLNILKECDISEKLALNCLGSLVKQTVENIFAHGPINALSGPILRNELEIVSAEIAVLKALNPDIGLLYQALGKLTLDLAQAKLGNSNLDFAEMKTILSKLG